VSAGREKPVTNTSMLDHWFAGLASCSKVIVIVCGPSLTGENDIGNFSIESGSSITLFSDASLKAKAATSPVVESNRRLSFSLPNDVIMANVSSFVVYTVIESKSAFEVEITGREPTPVNVILIVSVFIEFVTS